MPSSIIKPISVCVFTGLCITNSLRMAPEHGFSTIEEEKKRTQKEIRTQLYDSKILYNRCIEIYKGDTSITTETYIQVIKSEYDKIDEDKQSIERKIARINEIMLCKIKELSELKYKYQIYTHIIEQHNIEINIEHIIYRINIIECEILTSQQKIQELYKEKEKLEQQTMSLFSVIVKEEELIQQRKNLDKKYKISMHTISLCDLLK